MGLIGGKNKKKSRDLRIFFASDIHGSERCFRKFLAAAGVYEADAIVIGGDFSGKGLVPVIHDNGKLFAKIKGEEIIVPVEEEAHLLAEINRYGYYSRRMEVDEVDLVKDDKKEVERLFQEEIAKQLTHWCELAEERLPKHVRCIVTPGNDDPGPMDIVIDSSTKVECPTLRWTDLGPFAMISVPYTPPTPWFTEREISEEQITVVIDDLMLQAPSDRPVIMSLHCPPYGSGLDNAPELDETLRPVIRGGRPSFIPVGSVAVRDAIKKYQPALGLHGHIHESRAVQKIGSTLCVNPGSDYSADVLRGAVIDLASDGTVLDFLLTAG